jgi:hypothetical protein
MLRSRRIGLHAIVKKVEALTNHRSERVLSMQAINAQNQFRGRITKIIDGPVASEIDVETAHGIVLLCQIEFH